MKKRIRILIWIVTIIAIIVALKYADHQFKNRKLSEIIIELDLQGSEELITDEEIRTLIQQGHDSIHEQEVGSIDLQMIENLILTNPYVSSVNAFVNMDASLEIKVVQKVPILRVFNKMGQSYYIDSDGCLLPLHPMKSVYVPVANGNISQKYAASLELRKLDTITEDQSKLLPVLEKLFHISLIIKEDSLLRNLIAQIYVKDSSHFELVPVIGNHQIVFGDAFDAEEKLKKLKYFYSEAYRMYDLGMYKSLDLRFRNQIVCIKK